MAIYKLSTYFQQSNSIEEISARKTQQYVNQNIDSKNVKNPSNVRNFFSCYDEHLNSNISVGQAICVISLNNGYFYLGWLATAAFFEYIPFFGDSSLQFFLRLPILQVNR